MPKIGGLALLCKAKPFIKGGRLVVCDWKARDKCRPGGLHAEGQAGMPVAICTFRRNVSEGGEQGENRYILRNKANKSFRINSSSC